MQGYGKKFNLGIMLILRVLRMHTEAEVDIAQEEAEHMPAAEAAAA